MRTMAWVTRSMSEVWAALAWLISSMSALTPWMDEDDFTHGAARVPGEVRAGLHSLHAGLDQRLDLARGAGTAGGQVAHLAGHHGKAASLLAGACCFHGSIERQDVGLKRDAVDDADDVGNAA